jgi:hypothetical protein
MTPYEVGPRRFSSTTITSAAGAEAADGVTGAFLCSGCNGDLGAFETRGLGYIVRIRNEHWVEAALTYLRTYGHDPTDPSRNAAVTTANTRTPSNVVPHAPASNSAMPVAGACGE